MDVTALSGLLRPISLLLQYKDTGKTGDKDDATKVHNLIPNGHL